MTDISKKILSIDPLADAEREADAPETTASTASDTATDGRTADETQPPLLRTIVDIPAPTFRPIIQLVDPTDGEPPAKPVSEIDITFEEETAQTPELPISPSVAPPVAPPVAAPMRAFDPTPVAPSVTAAPKPRSLGWTGALLTVLTGLSLAALIVAYVANTDGVGPFGLAALILAATVPMIAVVTFWASLRSFGEARAETVRLAAIADRLTRADETVANDISQLSSAIRRELALVDSRLAQTRAEIETLGAIIDRQSADTDSMTRKIAERTDRIATTAKTQRDALKDVTNGIDTQIDALSATVKQTSDGLAASADETVERVEAASKALDKTLRDTAAHGDAIALTSQDAGLMISDAEARLSGLSTALKTQTDTLETVLSQRSEQIETLIAKLSDDKAVAEQALYKQSDLLGAVDAQIEMTEARLTALVDHARDIQDQLTARLSDIDSTLSDADRRSRAFTSDIADRVSDSVAQTRRELSIMEGEIRTLQSRMDDARIEPSVEPPLSTNVVEAPRRTPAPSRVRDTARLDLTPLDASDMDAADDLSIPEPSQAGSLVDQAMTVPLDSDLTATIQPRPEPAEILTRPGTVTQDGSLIEDRPAPVRSTGPAIVPTPEKDWRWRDMLGSIEPALSPKQKPVDRPGPGVPLTAPPEGLDQAEGSDVVARLCEVQLAPSTVIDETLIAQAASARRTGGEAAMASHVFSSVNAPIIHLRGVLAADLEFRLRAESFRRHFSDDLDRLADPAELTARLSSASGRAYMLCAAALLAG